MMRALFLTEGGLALIPFVAWLYERESANRILQFLSNLHVGWVLAPLILVFLHLLAKSIYDESEQSLDETKKQVDHFKALYEKAASERTAIGESLDQLSRYQNVVVGLVGDARGELLQHLARGENILVPEKLSASKATEFVKETRRMIVRYLKDKCLSNYEDTADFPDPKTGNPSMAKVYLENHLRALRAVAENFTPDDLRNAPQAPDTSGSLKK